MIPYLESREALFNRLEKAGFSQRRAASEDGICRKTLRRAIDRHGLTESIRQRQPRPNQVTGPTVKQADPERPPWEIARWRMKEEALKRDLKRERAINKELSENASIVQATARIVVPWMEEHMRLPPLKTPKKPEHQDEPVWLLVSVNDNHFGATFDLHVMGGLNAFSPGICAQRIAHFSDVVRRWVLNYESMGHPVAGIVMVFNGDNFNGSLAHEDTSNYARVVQQAGDIAAIHAQFVWEIAHVVPEILCVCPGGDNHTRSTKRSLNSIAAAHTSWSTLYHWAMKAMLRDVKNIKFHIDTDRQVFVQICGRTWGMTHGDLIKGGGGNLGFPAYGARRHHDGSLSETVVLAKRVYQNLHLDTAMDDSEKLTKVMEVLGGIVDHSLMAHFHIDMKLPFPAGFLHVAPSLMGTDTFAKDSLRKFSPAAQKFWALHPEHDIIGEHTVRLQHIIHEDECRYHWGVLGDELLAPDDLFTEFVTSQE